MHNRIPKVQKINAIEPGKSLIVLGKKLQDYSLLSLHNKEHKYLKENLEKEETTIFFNRYGYWLIAQVIEENKDKTITMEALRKAGNKVYNHIIKQGTNSLTIVCTKKYSEEAMALTEGLVLSLYRFSKYQKKNNKNKKKLKKINLTGEGIDEKKMNEMVNVWQGVFYARDLVNEPANFLNATELSKAIEVMGKAAGFSVNVLKRKQIESLKMGGLLAVNKGSIDPPTFTVIEWRPKNARNKTPYVIVGKGIMFDTGGLNLKQTTNGMDTMKSDMAGAAAVAGLFYALAKNKVPVYMVGLIPATDNRPDGNAFAPGDIIKMYNGLTVEVISTDAEGRMILADALSYGDTFKPSLVISIATLTGSARNALGIHGIAAMGNADKTLMQKLTLCGNKVYERIVVFPFWDEYKEMIKSDVADIKNLGGKNSGAITAGKFLEHFTKNSFVHLDIAGPAFITSSGSYRGIGGTGVGVRLIYEFIKSLS